MYLTTLLNFNNLKFRFDVPSYNAIVTDFLD